MLLEYHRPAVCQAELVSKSQEATSKLREMRQRQNRVFDFKLIAGT